MITDPYRYVMDFFAESRGDAHLGQIPVTIDWEPAREWVRMLAIRRGRMPPELADGDAEVEPVWHPTAGRPCVSGFRVKMTAPGAGEEGLSCDIPSAYLGGLATRISGAFIKQGLLKQGEYFRYVVSALPKPAEETARPKRLFKVRTVTPALEFSESSLAEFRSRAVREGEALPGGSHADETHADDMPVFIHRRVLDEAKAQAGSAGSKETGGVLIGYLHLDRSAPEAFIEITAQIPATHAKSELTRLGFTPEVWAAVRAEVERRGNSEIWLGYWHAHNYMMDTCKKCKKAGEGSCKVDPAFFSHEDAMLLRTVFPRAYSVGLVVGESPCLGTTLALYGYRRGPIVRRGWQVLNGEKAEGEMAAAVRADDVRAAPAAEGRSAG